MPTNQFNPKRLSIARRRRGLTKRELAARVEITSRMITAYEGGEKEPSAATLTRLAEVLDFPEPFFAGSDLDELPMRAASLRALSYLTAQRRDQALASGTLALAFCDWLQHRFVLPEPSIPKLQGVAPETAAIALRSSWGLGQRPIRNMVHLLEAQGVRVFSLAEECRDLDAYSFWRWEGKEPFVFLNTIKSAEHSRMDAAHELGHLILHWQFGAQTREAEREAEQFASAFLMPGDAVKASAPRGGNLVHVLTYKAHWNVSAVALTYRLHKLGVISTWQYHTLFVEMSRRGYRSSEPSGSHPESSQVLDKALKSLREEGVSMRNIADDLSVPVSELNNLVFGLTLGSVPEGGQGAGWR